MSVSARFLPYGRQVIDDDDIAAVAQALRGDFLTTGPAVDAFEADFARIVGAKEAVVCGNATQALHIGCIALGLGAGDTAIVPTVTFLATANAVRYTGADVIFSDVDPDTGLMTPGNFEYAIKRAKAAGLKPKVVLPVHLAGQSVDLAVIQEIARREGMAVLTDSCHALCTTYRNVPSGSCQYEDIAVFSFHPVKTIAMGEGGAVTTNDSAMAAKLRLLRGHGMMHRSTQPIRPEMGLDEQGQPNPWYYEMAELGYNYRESDIHCALGISQLKKLDKFITRRRELALLYDQLLAPLAPVILPPKRVADCVPGWHLYAVRIDFEKTGHSRASFMHHLKEKNIGTQVHYIPVHLQPYYRDLYGNQKLVGADAYYSSTLSLPLFPSMSDEDARYVVDSLRQVMVGRTS